MTKSDALSLINDNDRLAKELTEIFRLSDCAQLGPYHLEGDVLTHTRLVVANLRNDAPTTLIWAAILHDVAKPLTESRREREGEIITQFFKHEIVGADLAYEITGRFGLSEEERQDVKWLVRNHMRISNLPQMREFKARQLVSDSRFGLLFELMRSDIAASHSRTEEISRGKEELIKEIEMIYVKYH